MQILHIVRQFSPSIGGLEASVFNLAGIQRRQLAIDARVVTLNRVFGNKAILPAAENIAGIPVTRLPWAGSSRYPLTPSVLRHIQDADVLHVHGIDFFFDFLALTRPWHRRPMIASTHGGFFHTKHASGLKKIWFKTLTRASIAAYDQIVACSHSDAAMFHHYAGEKLTTIENGIDQTRFAGAAARRQTRTIICFGRFTAHKRIDQAFPLLAQLKSLHPDWRLIIAGREGEVTAAQLMARARAAGVAEDVTCVTEPNDAELRELIGQASYFTCLSSYEGFGLAAVEAMSAGLFPVLSDIQPFQRLVDAAKIGLTLPADAARAAAREIEASVLEDDTAYEARQQFITAAVRRYDWTHVASKYARLYEEATQTSGRLPVAASFGAGE